MILFFVLLTLLTSGCVNFPDNNKETRRNIYAISAKMPANSTEVMSINYTMFSNYVTNLNKTVTIGYPNGISEQKTINYSIRNDSTNDQIGYYISLEFRSTIFDCIIYYNKVGNYSHLSATKYGSASLTDKEIEETKNLLKADVENITRSYITILDWSRANWTINYAD